MTPFEQLFSNSQILTVTSVLLALVIAFIRESIVPGVTHTRALAAKDRDIAKLEEQRDEFKRIAFAALDVTRRAASVGEQLASR